MYCHNEGTTFILGAGASCGHILNNSQNPPIMNNFLSSSVKDEILKSQEFPELVSYIQEITSNENLLEACESIESESKKNLEKFLGDIEDLWILHLGLFYIYSYLGKFCKNPISKESAYIQLAEYIKNNQKNVNGVINLNYDILFDQALEEKIEQINYALTTNTSTNFPYIKPHGSLNFRFPHSSFVKMPCKNWQDYISQRNSTILTNTLSGPRFLIEKYEPNFNFEKDFCTNGNLTYAPAIVMPLGRNKDYFQLDSYNNMWHVIKKTLTTSSELVVIGCALNDEDTKLWETLNEIKRNTVIKIVSKDRNSSESIAEKFCKKSFKNVIPRNVCGFYKYAKNYLENGKT